ncbi:FtsX-like permease family protein [uncultured Pseudoteredinibacter sp.]|uniref:ABC transporter permease n=1 Tax=uncultured Pseudoteredinibacter sp. TaxID=1641701 RepID=UPI00262E6BFE|nr:FtsX-like permease family protein [uncultured Pseudoteredinibacter sp.]
MFISLAYKSLLNRKESLIVSLIALSVSIFVLLGVEHIRLQSKESFAKAISGTDLIVGARSGPLNLLLYSVFHIGSPNNNLSWQSYQEIAQHPKVKWSIPLSMGDSHRGYRVIASNQDYFKYFQYGQNQTLQFEQGHAYETVLDVVLGAEVAQRLGYKVGDKLHIAHGIGSSSFHQHDDYSFTVSGILKATGTAVDKSLISSLAGIEIIHDKQLANSLDLSHLKLENSNITSHSITAFMLGLERKIDIFKLQRLISSYPKEPLLAILPGVTLKELWHMMGSLENILRLVSALVLISALLGLLALQMANARERKQEIKLLRVIGASPIYIFSLVQLETLLLTVTSMAFGALMLFIALSLGQSLLSGEYGIYISANFIGYETIMLAAWILLAAILAASLPAVQAYRHSLSALKQ